MGCGLEFKAVASLPATQQPRRQLEPTPLRPGCTPLWPDAGERGHRGLLALMWGPDLLCHLSAPSLFLLLSGVGGGVNPVHLPPLQGPFERAGRPGRDTWSSWINRQDVYHP